MSALLICALIPAANASYALDGEGAEEAQETIADALATQAGSATTEDPVAHEEDATSKADDASQTEDATGSQTDEANEKQPDSDSTANGAAQDAGVAEEQATGEAQAATDAASVTTQADDDADAEVTTVEGILNKMTLDEKIAQMIVPAIRMWNDVNVTDLAAVPELAAALRRHQYGGVMLTGSNVVNASQTAALVSALQDNNDAGDFSTNVPYLMPVDEEGGMVVRFSMGTRMTGNMAIGALSENAALAARETGEVLGEEMSALGFNVDFGPAVDVNSNPLNPVIGVRSFGDDPQAVANLGIAFCDGLSSKGIIPTVKHFPGHGDTDSDSHTDLPAVHKTIDQLRETELVPFSKAIEQGVDLIMTAHVTLPVYDDEVVFEDGTVGYYPATMSKKVLTGLLRDELGYDGIVVTDALEMEAVNEANFVPGAPGSAEYAANIATTCISAGADLLLVPRDLTDAGVVDFYDEYLQTLANKVSTDEDLQARVDQSVTRILELKQKYGILDRTASQYGLDVVGSDEHHAVETHIASQAITLVKNDDHTLPASGHDKNVVLLSCDQGDNVLLSYAVQELMDTGLVDQDAFVNNLAAGTTSGSAESGTSVTIDYYCDGANYDSVHYTDELKSAIAQADTVVALTKNKYMSQLQPTSAPYQGIATILEDTHAAGGRFVLISGGLPYDVARYQDADAILCAYMSTAKAIDPTARNEQNTGTGAYSANPVVAFETVFDRYQPVGILPVRVPTVTTTDDEGVTYDVEETLYERGHGMNYMYLFLQGAGGVYVRGSKESLTFVNNARYDMLTSLAVDDTVVEEGQYSTDKGSTVVTLNGDFLETLEDGDHVLTATHAYATGDIDVTTEFTVTSDSSAPSKTPSDSPSGSDSGTSTAAGSSTPSNTLSRSSYSSGTTAPRAVRQSGTTASKLTATGDATNVVVPVVLAALAVAAFVAARAYRRTRP